MDIVFNILPIMIKLRIRNIRRVFHTGHSAGFPEILFRVTKSSQRIMFYWIL